MKLTWSWPRCAREEGTRGKFRYGGAIGARPLRPTSEKVSKQHCLLLRAGKVFVHDFNSRNGTFVNGERVARPTELHDGDILKIGPLGFTVRQSVPVDQATPLPFHGDAANEDAIAELLLEMDASEIEAENTAHSTTVEMPRPELEAPAAPAPVAAVPAPNKPTAPPKPTASTADAAQKLLAQMARRDRK